MLDIAIIGHGRMGRLVERLAPEAGCRVVLAVDSAEALATADLSAVKVAVEFTHPESALRNIERLADAGVAVVTGTTGWYARMDEARGIVERTGTGLVWSANFSVGVQMFFRIVAEAARLASGQRNYHAYGWEWHHAAKKDAPSGTMTMIERAMLDAGFGGELPVASIRAGHAPGTHEVAFDSPDDTITLRHAARGREGFARGALHAAHWISGRKGFYEFAEVLFGA